MLGMPRPHGSGILGARPWTRHRRTRRPRLTAAACARRGRPPADAERGRAHRARTPRATFTGSRSALLLLATLGLRLWGIKQGLPYSYNTDEATHFVPRAIAFFSHDSTRTTSSTRRPTPTC